jgi:hypothetical protein
MDNFKGYVYTIFSGLLLAAAVTFTALQCYKTSNFTLYGKDMETRTVLLIVFSAVGGIVVMYLVRLFVRGVRLLRKVRGARRLAQAAADKPAPAGNDAR